MKKKELFQWNPIGLYFYLSFILIRSIIALSKKFLTIITKDNNKIIRDIKIKLYSVDNEFISNYQK